MEFIEIEAKKMTEARIRKIESEKEYPCNPDYYYCWNLCSQRNNACPYKPQPVSKNKNEYYNPETDWKLIKIIFRGGLHAKLSQAYIV